MNQQSNLNTSLKQAFQAVANDIGKLRRRDQALKEQLSILNDKLQNVVSRDEFFRIVRKFDDDLKEMIDRDYLRGVEDQLKMTMRDMLELPERDIKKITHELDEVQTRQKKHEKSLAEQLKAMSKESSQSLKDMQKDASSRIKEIKNEFAKTENLKREVREVSSLKKALLTIDDTYASKKKLETAFDEIDEIYDLVEQIEKKALFDKDLDSYKKEVQRRLKKFDERIKDAEDLEEELVRKTKDIYTVEKHVDDVRKEQAVLANRMKLLDASKQIDSVHLTLLKEINKLDTKIASQREIMKELNMKLNDVIKTMNKQQPVPLRKTTKKVEKDTDRVIRKQQIQKLEKRSPEKKQQTFWMKVVDWFTEEIDEPDEKKPTVRKSNKSAKKTTKNGKKK
jgi:uncharacterized coiled-coil protein SlyX